MTASKRHFESHRTSSLRSLVQVVMAPFLFFSCLKCQDELARNYKKLLNFVKVMRKILVVPFFPDTVYLHSAKLNVSLIVCISVTAVLYISIARWRQRPVEAFLVSVCLVTYNLTTIICKQSLYKAVIVIIILPCVFVERYLLFIVIITVQTCVR